MAQSMDADAWAAALVPSLLSDVSGMEPFEVDQFSRAYVREHMETDARVSKCMNELGVDRDNALRVLHVVLRDEMLRQLGLPPAQS